MDMSALQHSERADNAVVLPLRAARCSGGEGHDWHKRRTVLHILATNKGVEMSEQRLLKRISQRDRRIAGMQRRIVELEHALAVKDVEVKRLPRDVTRAVQEALCNVRMIPVLGIRSNDKIIEVRDARGEK
jgi:hypothetical protein